MTNDKTLWLIHAEREPETFKAMTVAYALEQTKVPFREEDRKRFEQMANGYVDNSSLIYDGEFILGFVTSWPVHIAGLPHLHIACAYVQPQYRRHGVGTEAIKLLLGESVARLVTEVLKTNTGGQAFVDSLANELELCEPDFPKAFVPKPIDGCVIRVFRRETESAGDDW